MAGVGASKARAWRVVSPTRNEAERSAGTEIGEVELGEARASGKTRCNNYYHLDRGAPPTQVELSLRKRKHRFLASP